MSFVSRGVGLEGLGEGIPLVVFLQREAGGGHLPWSSLPDWDGRTVRGLDLLAWPASQLSLEVPEDTPPLPQGRKSWAGGGAGGPGSALCMCSVLHGACGFRGAVRQDEVCAVCICGDRHLRYVTYVIEDSLLGLFCLKCLNILLCCPYSTPQRYCQCLSINSNKSCFFFGLTLAVGFSPRIY